ncbi:GNAT family N-acetyltransferase [Rheinheimera sp. UJ63]|uniref:GNAT family N-acetyltransferase n=1 Tax=Rheinheimera sp. UJ63 TaxID=2910157 RepID=UPI001F3664EA|nr:GNAT family protein [Rheinheimera sp. UJ63]MCF4009491.1 GNAT family N-acetyltransferase [Rheinheimera sp. UJ63]
MDLIGHRVKLSPLDNSDRELFIQISMCPKMMTHVYEPCTYEEAIAAFEVKAQLWDSNGTGWLSFGISDLASTEKLGNIGLKMVDDEAKVAEVGFMIKLDAQGKGFAAEALKLVRDFALTELGLNKLVATCSVSNVGSFKVLEKLGFVREACLKKNTLIKGQLVDDYIYHLCKSTL